MEEISNNKKVFLRQAREFKQKFTNTQTNAEWKDITKIMILFEKLSDVLQLASTIMTSETTLNTSLSKDKKPIPVIMDIDVKINKAFHDAHNCMQDYQIQLENRIKYICVHESAFWIKRENSDTFATINQSIKKITILIKSWEKATELGVQNTFNTCASQTCTCINCTLRSSKSELEEKHFELWQKDYNKRRIETVECFSEIVENLRQKKQKMTHKVAKDWKWNEFGTFTIPDDIKPEQSIKSTKSAKSAKSINNNIVHPDMLFSKIALKQSPTKPTINVNGNKNNNSKIQDEDIVENDDIYEENYDKIDYFDSKFY